MLSYLGATAFQLFIYCWFGNDMMLESVSVANAAWDSAWPDIKSKRFRFGIRMITHRSQKVILITAGGFANVTLDTFTTILRAAYSCFAVLKKVEN
ncbi:odorant receptor Or2-like [Athalia rosae]|uniref:odorant receptor Or2-like n=1 Tax=Athalia rosae TaxID=37344 RepID=UPI002033AE1C|nr:odorant receptor Or2-like [Athalia rosae]